MSVHAAYMYAAFFDTSTHSWYYNPIMQQHINITNTNRWMPQDYSFGYILVAKNMADTIGALASGRDVSHMPQS